MRKAETAIVFTGLAVVIQCTTRLTAFSRLKHLPGILNTVIMFIMQKEETGLGIPHTVIWLKNPPILFPLR